MISNSSRKHNFSHFLAKLSISVAVSCVYLSYWKILVAWKMPMQMWKRLMNVVQSVRMLLVNKDKGAAFVFQFVSNTTAKLQIET